MMKKLLSLHLILLCFVTAAALICFAALDPALFVWIWYMVPELNLFGSMTNILGAVWFVCIFFYSLKMFRVGHKFAIITSVCLATCTGFVVLYSLDEMNSVIIWTMYRFEYELFLAKIGVYASLIIAFWTVRHFAGDYFSLTKKTVVLLAVLAVYYVVSDAVMIGNYGTIMYRVIPEPDKQISFWTLYTLCKVYWSIVFLSLWKHDDVVKSKAHNGRHLGFDLSDNRRGKY